ncbi:hypothetical protein Tco_1130429 [Tanacetum coccineum]
MSAANDVKFQEANKDSVFIEGMDVGVRNSNKKSGRKSIKKTKKVARQKGVGGLGTSEKGASDVYKVFNDDENGTNKPFVFRSTGRVESDSKSCSINMEQGGKGFGFTYLVSSDNSGRIIMIWDARSFTYKGGLGDERFVAVRGEWKDLNVVRGHDERMNSQINIKETCEFNDFINEAKLIKIPMREKIYKIVALDQKVLDHCPIVLKDVDLDFGQRPFRSFDIWLEEKDIGHVVEEAWKVEVRNRRSDCRFRDKLKNVKAALKKWSKERFGLVNEKIERFKNEAMK